MSKFFNNLKNIYQQFFFVSSGTIIFTAGKYDLFVDAFVNNKNIQFEIETNDESTCSYLNSNKFSIEPQHQGFIIRAEIESEEVKFIWTLR